MHSNRSCDGRLENRGRAVVVERNVPALRRLGTSRVDPLCFCAVLVYPLIESGELPSELASELVEPDGDKAGVVGRTEADDPVVGRGLEQFLPVLHHGEPCSS